MSTVTLELGDDVMALLRQSHRPAPETARELVVMELYRRGTISGGKAAELLGMSRLEFIHSASYLGIPYFSMTQEEWQNEAARIEGDPVDPSPSC